MPTSDTSTPNTTGLGNASFDGSSSDSAASGSALAAVPAGLRQRATTIQVIGAPPADRSAQRQQRLGFSLLVALALGWDSLMLAANSGTAFHTSIGRFLLIFVVTVGSIRALGNLYDNYLDEAEARRRMLDAEQQSETDAASSINTNQPATSAD